MAATLAQIRQLVGELLQDEDYVQSVATGGDVTYLVDTARLQALALGEGLYRGGWLLLPANADPHRERRIDQYAPEQGQVSWQTPLAAAVAAGAAYELWPGYRPLGVHRAINRALTRMRVDATVTVAGVSGQTAYDLSATFPWLTSPDQVYEALHRGGSAGQYTWSGQRSGAVLSDGGAVSLQLVGGDVPSSGDTIALRVRRPLSSLLTAADGVTPVAALAAETDRVPCSVEWAATEAAWEVLDTALRSAGLEQRALLERELARMTAKVNGQRAANPTALIRSAARADSADWMAGWWGR